VAEVFKATDGDIGEMFRTILNSGDQASWFDDGTIPAGLASKKTANHKFSNLEEP